MSSLKQIQANRLNALKSTGPRTEEGKRRSRGNALRHGLTAETIIGALEDAAEYEAFELSILDGYAPRTTAERELASRLASVLWRLRRATNIETALLQIQAELLSGRGQGSLSLQARQPQWYDDLDVAATTPTRPDIGSAANGDRGDTSREVSSQRLAYC